MKFIKPSEISSKVMTLFEESDEYVLIVSPYVKILKWYKLLKKFEDLKNRNIPFEFFIRDDNSNQNSFYELDQLGFNYTAIPDLHCKLYLNEQTAIVSSMNMLLSSEINSLELGYQTETKKEYDELYQFYERYLNLGRNKGPETNTNAILINQNMDWRDVLGNELANHFGRYVNLNQDGYNLHINTGSNNYEIFIYCNRRQNVLRLSGILSNDEYYALQRNHEVFEKSKLEFEATEGNRNYYSTIWATLPVPLNSKDLAFLFDNEKELVTNCIFEFVLLVEDFKSRIR